MLSLPNKLRAAAMELLERVRLGLDIPSRAEVLDLAERIEAISVQLNQLEAGRVRDSKLVEELRQNAASVAAPPKRAPRKKRNPATEKSEGGDKQTKSDGPGEVKAKTRPKAKPRSRKRTAAADDK